MILDFLDDWERRARMDELLPGALDSPRPIESTRDGSIRCWGSTACDDGAAD